MKKGSGTEFVTIWEQAFREAQKDLFLKSEELDEVCRIGKQSGIFGSDAAGTTFEGMCKAVAANAGTGAERVGGEETYYRILGWQLESCDMVLV